MGLITSSDLPNRRELYTGQLLYLLSTERQIVKDLPRMNAPRSSRCSGPYYFPIWNFRNGAAPQG